MVSAPFRKRDTRRRLAAFALVLAGTAAAEEAPHPVTMWRMDGADNRVYLLGSIHLLRPGDHPLPAVIDEAYADADTLLMEMDVDDADPLQAQKLVNELGLIQGDRKLVDLMGEGPYGRAETFANAVNIPLGMLSSAEPWLAAITVEQLMLQRIGFDPKYGVEHYLAGKAEADGKDVIGLETIREQLEFLDNMSLAAQRALLLQSLEESAEIAKVMDELVRAWRYGDLEFLETRMLDEMRDYPELYEAIVVDRNRRWVKRVEALAKEPDDYLVVVGALHLIGEDGLPTLLEASGHKLVQMNTEL